MTDEDRQKIAASIKYAKEIVKQMPWWKQNCLIMASQSTNSRPRTPITPKEKTNDNCE